MALLGRKMGMTTGYGPEGEAIPVTVIKAGPCKVLATKAADKDGYQSVMLGFEEVEGAKIKSKPQLGVFKKLGTACFKTIREINNATAEQGADLNVSQFAPGDLLWVEGVSKGHGWTSVIKKWNFGTGRESHGGNCQRKMGSSGMHTWPAHVIKGKKMSGRWGSEKITLRSVEVVKVLPEDHLLLVKGPVPGIKHGLLKLRKLGVKKAKQVQKEKAA